MESNKIGGNDEKQEYNIHLKNKRKKEKNWEMAGIKSDNRIFSVLDTASEIPASISYFIPERQEKRRALESVPEIRMFISQLHPPSQAAILILFVFFQQLLPSPQAGL